MNIPDLIFQQAIAAIDAGDVVALKGLIEQYPNLPKSRIEFCDDQTLLLYLVNWPGGKNNGVQIAKLLLASGADPNIRSRGENGETVLHWASSNERDIEIIPALLEGGADINALGGCIWGGTALMNAVYFGFSKVAARLVEHGATVHNLILAAGLGRLDLIQSWHRGQGYYLCDAAHVSPFQVSDGEKLLSQQERDHLLYSAMISALCCRQYHISDWFLANGFDINLIPPEVDWSCLHHAAYRGSLPMAMYLVARGADLNVRSSEHQVTPFDFACAHGHPDVMNYLIDLGDSIDLEMAAYCGRLDKVVEGYATCDNTAMLLQRTIGDKTPIGKPVHPKIRLGRLEVARYLLQKEPHLGQREENGTTAIALAHQLSDADFIELMS